MDGIDAVAVDFGAEPDRTTVRVLAHARRAYPAALRSEFAALNRSGPDEIHRGAIAANALARESAALVEALLARAALAPTQIAAIASHGQTVRHRPGEFDGTGYTVQLNAPALLAELTGIDVVADLRSRDVAAGGQGAPLVPAFHRAVFAAPGRAVAIVNLGGIANLTAIDARGETIGFDCGPANTLLDLWSRRASGRDFDIDGAAAARGRVDTQLLAALRAEPYFDLPPPKSTGLDLFNAAWLDSRLDRVGALARLSADDIQATLAELTAQAVAEACHRHAEGASELIVCGGGAFNADLMNRLARRLAPMPVVESGARGLPADQVEAAAFAWLARAFVARRPGNLATVTGAVGPRVLGALYPAR